MDEVWREDVIYGLVLLKICLGDFRRLSSGVISTAAGGAPGVASGAVLSVTA